MVIGPFVGKSKELKQPPCPVCHGLLDSIAPTKADTPDPDFLPGAGDFSVCVYCAAILRFGLDGIRLQVATDADLKELSDQQPSTFKLLQKVAAAAKRRIRMARRMNRRYN